MDMACCASTMGAPCGHKAGGQAVSALAKLREGTADAVRVDYVARDAAYSYTDYEVVARRGGRDTRIAEVTIYDDGRILAKRAAGVRTSTDYADWSRVNRVAGGTSETYYAGVLMPWQVVTVD